MAKKKEEMDGYTMFILFLFVAFSIWGYLISWINK